MIQSKRGIIMDEKINEKITQIILNHYPDTEAIYLFGTFDTPNQREESDMDIAILLTPAEAKQVGSLVLSKLYTELRKTFNREVDLINLRLAPTVLQKEIIADNRRIYVADEYAVAEFEMLTISYYQRLNEERAEIIEDALKVGRLVV